MLFDVIRSVRYRAFMLAFLLLAPHTLPAEPQPSLFVRFSTDREGLYSGESFQLTLAIHISGMNLDKPVAITGLPPTDQLRLGPFQELPIETVTLEGRPYEVRRFRCRAEARQDGLLLLSPTLEGTLIQETRSHFFVQRQQRPVSLPVQPLSLVIRPLPEAGRPADFSGAVGRFSLQATAVPLDVAVGDLITVTLRLEGEKLPDLFAPPRIPEGPGLRTYEMKPVPEETSGTQHVFRQTVVALDPSVPALPAITFTFFDARGGLYRTLTAGPFPLTFHSERMTAQPVYAPLTSSATIKPALASAPPSPRTGGWFERLANKLLRRQPVIISGDRDLIVRMAPSDSSKTLFTLTPGSTVYREASFEGWIRISCPNGIGWIPAMPTVPTDAPTP
jgi:hypothetical protein